MYTLECTSRQSCVTALQANVSSFFQTALLISADPVIAEAGVAAAMDDLDLLLEPDKDGIGEIHKAIALQTITRLGPQEPVDISDARCMLQTGLWPLLEVEQAPRVCFVLRMLLGVAMSSCAQALGLEEADVRALLQVALRQLRQASDDLFSQVSSLNASVALIP